MISLQMEEMEFEQPYLNKKRKAEGVNDFTFKRTFKKLRISEKDRSEHPSVNEIKTSLDHFGSNINNTCWNKKTTDGEFGLTAPVFYYSKMHRNLVKSILQEEKCQPRISDCTLQSLGYSSSEIQVISQLMANTSIQKSQ